MISHIVMFRFRDRADIAEAITRLASLTGQIPGLLSLRTGSNVNTGPNAHDLVLITQHDDEDDLRLYAAHPVHRELLEWLTPRIIDRSVVDSTDLSIG